MQNEEIKNALQLSQEHLYLLQLAVAMVVETQKDGSSEKQIKMADGRTISIKAEYEKEKFNDS
jgi:cob(I)alamin adenosyltransferase